MTRDKILQAAKELFEEKGFDHTTVREIAAKAEVNVALINYHFGSKEALLADLIEQMASYMHIRLSDISKSSLSPSKKLEQTVEAMVERIFENKKYYQMIHREISTVQRPDLSQKIFKTLKKNREEVKKIIEEGQQKKIFRKNIDTELTIGTIFGLIYQATNTRLKLNLSDDEESFKKRVRDHLLDMMTCFLEIESKK